MAVGKRIGEPVKRESTCHACGARIECEGKEISTGFDICEQCDAKQRARQPKTYPPIFPQPIPIVDKEWPRPYERPRPMWEVTCGDRTPLSDYVTTTMPVQQGTWFN